MSNTGTEGRRAAVAKVAGRKTRNFTVPTDEQGRIRASAEFGRLVFGETAMREHLPRGVFKRLRELIDNGRQLDATTAAVVAHAAKEWAMENGATHFCHWFQPLTGLTAEKHDAFLKFGSDGSVIEGFDGSQLIQSEPDASSFPSGGMRTTFEARGYTAWDPASPMFLLTTETGSTLCIPSAYLSYTGHALDEKTGLLRSVEALQRSVRRLLATQGDEDIRRVSGTVGAEQEYFLVDRAFLAERPDLQVTERTVLGAPPPKGQQLDDHYFGSISPRVLAFMNEFEHELYQLGVPVKTRHNEVAPGQYEMAPIFEEANVAADHNQLSMEIMRRVARRHDFKILFHEKPFARINGTGKHLNWSVAVQRPSGEWENLFEPGDTPADNLRFLLMTAAVLEAIHSHAGVLRAAIASSGNDHRLGANEAPPAIISVFVGGTLTRILDRLASGSEESESAHDDVLNLGVAHLPDVQKDNTDRNRTSPFAFTGNKWEFRACGGSSAVSFPTTLLTTAVADAIDRLAGEIEARMADGASSANATLEVIRDVARRTTPVRFEGDGYSQAWQDEAAERGLPNLKDTPTALAWLADPEKHRFLVDHSVFTSDEIVARVNVRVERYVNDLGIEYGAMLRLVDTAVIPAASGYLGELCSSIQAAQAAGIAAPQQKRAGELADLLGTLSDARDELVAIHTRIENEATDGQEHAARYAAELKPAMDTVRSAADAIELICGDAWWPLPRYQEMLFVR